MPYADITDVRALTPQRVYDGESEPTVNDVNLFCQTRSQELDGYVAARGYTVPVSEAASPVAFGWLKAAAGYGAAADAEAAAVARARSDEAETNRLSYLTRQWERMVDALRAGDVDLVDATSPGDTSTARSRVRGGFAGAVPVARRSDMYVPSYGATGRQGAW